MCTPEQVRQWAMALPETEEMPHYEILSFRIKKKIFATLNAPENRATLKFSPEMQDIFTNISKGAIFPVPNAWGKYGWTTVLLSQADPVLLEDALKIAWRETAPKVFQTKYPTFFEDTD